MFSGCQHGWFLVRASSWPVECCFLIISHSAGSPLADRANSLVSLLYKVLILS